MNASMSDDKILSSFDFMVTFNVGGHMFLVSKETLRRHTGQFTSTYLTAMCDPYWNSGTVVPIDRNPLLFEAVLEFLRYDRWRIPAGVPASDVFDEMVFYGYVVPRCSATMAWHRTKLSREHLIAKLATIDETLGSQMRDVVRTVLNSESAQMFVSPSAEYLERQLSHLGLPGLKLKIAELLRTSLEGATVHSQLYELLRLAEGPNLVAYIAHTEFYESRVDVETWTVNLEVVSRPGSVANDYRLCATPPTGLEGSRGTGASLIFIRAPR